MRPNEQRAKLAIVFLYFVAAASFIFSLHYLVNIYIINSYETGDSPSFEQLDKLLVFFSLGTILYAICYLLCAIFFILWFTRAYRNLQIVLPKSKFAYRPWAAAVVWFIPLWNIFGPYKIATNLFDKAEDYLMSEDKWMRNRNFDIVKGTWWALWITSAVLVRTSTYYANKNVLSVEANVGAFIGFLLSITCALVGVQMIKNYSKMEKLLMKLDSNDSSISSTITNDDLLDSGI
ncbi:MAG: DUF4328 domain-containing protein [Crocinitomicaceae bacterium]|nr:DUF4328 domain-containing protein [Crocinitomicaceae bacterium]